MPVKLKEIPFMPSTLETIDYAMYNWLNEELNLFTTTNEGWSKVPIIWATAERFIQSKEASELRDQDGTLILPRVTLERTAVVKDLTKKGSVWGNVQRINDKKGGSITVARRIKQDKTSNFANTDSRRLRGGVAGNKQSTYPRRVAFGRFISNDKIVYETISISIPVYLDITYSIVIKTEYQQQMNELVTPFMTKTDGLNYFVMSNENHTYEAFVQGDVGLDNNIASMETENRKYESKVDIKVLGYVNGEDKNAEQPKIVIRENAVEVKIPREKVIFGDIPEHIDKRGFYKE